MRAQNYDRATTKMRGSNATNTWQGLSFVPDLGVAGSGVTQEVEGVKDVGKRLADARHGRGICSNTGTLISIEKASQAITSGTGDISQDSQT